MFLRVVRAAGGQGIKHEYVRVVEAYRDHDGKTRHHTVINLGRKDLLAQHLDLGKLQRLLHGDASGDEPARSEDVAAIGAWDWGPTLAARHMWSELGLDDVGWARSWRWGRAQRPSSGFGCQSPRQPQ